MDTQRGHTGPMFKQLCPNGFAQCGWHTPDGSFYPAPSFLHETIAEMLWIKHYPSEQRMLPAVDALLLKEWVRAACDGYYEVQKFSGYARTVVLDLVAVLPPDTEVALDIIEGRPIHGLNADQFYDKYL